LGGASLDLGLIFDPARARAELLPIGAGERDIVGLIWFVVSLVDGLELALNGSPAATLGHRDTAALDLRTAPIARLSLTTSTAAPVASAQADASGAPVSGPPVTAAASAPVAYLISTAS